MKLINTPIERHGNIWVKREDLCCIDGPPFSKSRGVLTHLALRQEATIGVLDTCHSKAGWAVAAACKQLGKQCVNYYPERKAEPGRLFLSQQEALKLGAQVVPLPAGRSAILFHMARKRIQAMDGYMMPNALKLQESADETAKQVNRHVSQFDAIVVSVSSGTIAAGVLRGLEMFGHTRYGLVWQRSVPKVIIHMGYSRSKRRLQQYLLSISPGFPTEKIIMVDEGYNYADAAQVANSPPFPCNPFYDLKAWKWLYEHRGELPERTLFWNIGA